MKKIPFNKPFLTSREINYIKKAHELGQFSGDGFYTKECNKWFKNKFKKTNLLTHSCTAALEMSAILADIQPDDEIIMPSYTFVSTANAFVLRGGIPVFVDIDENTLNISANLIEKAITKKTKAIVPVHYAGVACEMDKILEIAKNNNLIVIEDAAQGFLAKYKDQYLGTIGDLGTYSFHETKNIISGEGGALSINDDALIMRAEIIREKGTNRSQFFRGQVDKYTWVDIGSSYLPGEVIAAFLFAQLENSIEINEKRLSIWNKYNSLLSSLEDKSLIKRPFIPDYATHNGHMYYLLLENLSIRTKFIKFLKEHNVMSVFHYIPLHSSPAGRKYGKTYGDLKNTNLISDTLVRLPLFYDMTNEDVEFIVNLIYKFFGEKNV